MKHKKRGSRLSKRDERSCVRRKKKDARGSGEPTFVNYCPVHSTGLIKEVARLSYSMRRGTLDTKSFKSACRLRRGLAKLVSRIAPALKPPRPSKKLRKPIKFVPSTGEHFEPAVVEPKKPLAMVSQRRAADLALYSVDSRFESFGVQAYLEACDEVSDIPFGPFTKANRKELPMDDDTYICCSADPVVQILAKPCARTVYSERLVLKPIRDVRKQLRVLKDELRDVEFFGLEHTLRQVADVAEGGGFLGSGSDLVGKTFMYVDGQPVLVELD